MQKLILILFIFLMGGVTTVNSSSKDPKLYVNKIFTKINRGDRLVLKDISYTNLKYIFDYLRENYDQIPFGKRGKVVNSALKGLFNKDPRVRLICIEMLRLMTPDRLMIPEVEKSYKNQTTFNLIDISNPRVSYSDYYIYHDLKGRKVKKSMLEEIVKLYKFVQRNKLMHQILRVDYWTLKSISKADFLLLTEQIDKESPNEIPFKSFGKNRFFQPVKLQFIIRGLDNPNVTVKQGCAEYIIKYYNHNIRELDLYKRNQILLALKKVYDDNVILKPRLVRVRRR